MPIMTTEATTKLNHLSPATCAVKAFGGVRALARAIGKSPSSVCRWNKSRRRGGCAGRIPSLAMVKILKAASAKGVTITAEELVSGRYEYLT